MHICLDCSETFTRPALINVSPERFDEPAGGDEVCPYCWSEKYATACECEERAVVDGLDTCSECHLEYLIENEPEDPEAIEAFAKEYGLPYSLPGEAA